MNNIIYLDLDNHVEVQKDEVRLRDVAKVVTEDKTLEEETSEMVIYRFAAKKNRQVISAIYLVGKLMEQYPDCIIQSIGETDVLVQKMQAEKDSLFVKLIDFLKIAAVCLISFFGAAFTIMAFHNDIGIRAFFQGFYYEVTGYESDGFTPLEAAYSIGLAVGILVFFNHFGKKKFSDDPTPVEVEMKMYENDINSALIEMAERKGEKLS